MKANKKVLYELERCVVLDRSGWCNASHLFGDSKHEVRWDARRNEHSCAVDEGCGSSIGVGLKSDETLLVDHVLRYVWVV